MKQWIETMLRSLSPAEYKNARMVNALRVKNPHIPRQLFRYRRPTECAMNEIANGITRLFSPVKFNDPYDCRFMLRKMDIGRANTRRTLANALGPIRNLLADNEFNICSTSADPGQTAVDFIISRDASAAPYLQSFLSLLRNAESKVAPIETARLSEQLRQDVRIVCLSGTGASMLMWSHYAQDHKGFCIEYPFHALPQDDRRRMAVFPVVYDKKVIDMTDHLLSDDFNRFALFLPCIHKADYWRYEREWRIIVTSGETVPDDFPMPTPARILLGANMDPSYEAKLRTLANGMGIAVQRVTIAHDAFKVGASRRR